MPDNTTNTPKLEVTWTPATCDGLPPVGTRIAIPGIDKNNLSYWAHGRIESYRMPDERPAEVHGDIPYITAVVDGFGGFIATAIELSQCPLLGIEKQPAGWPDHCEPPQLFETITYRYHVSDNEMARQMIAWLKENGYLKR